MYTGLLQVEGVIEPKSGYSRWTLKLKPGPDISSLSSDNELIILQSVYVLVIYMDVS